MTPRPDVSEERKNQILDAATEVFIHKGFDEARVDDIVDQAGLSKGTFYWYYKSKDDIIVAILDRIFQREFRQLDTLIATGGSATESITRFIEISLKDVSRFLRLMPIFYEFLALAFRSKVVQGAIKEYFNRYLDILISLVQHGIDRGEFRGVEAREFAVAIAAVFEGTLLLWIYDHDRVDIEQDIRSGIQLLLTGVQTVP